MVPVASPVEGLAATTRHLAWGQVIAVVNGAGAAAAANYAKTVTTDAGYNVDWFKKTRPATRPPTPASPTPR